MCSGKCSAMRSTASGTSSGQTTMPTQHHKCGQNCGQGQFLRGSAPTLWLLPELDLNQQPCDLRSNLLARSGHCLPMPASCAVSGCERTSLPTSCHRFLGEPGGKVGCRSSTNHSRPVRPELRARRWMGGCFRRSRIADGHCGPVWVGALLYGVAVQPRTARSRD